MPLSALAQRVQELHTKANLRREQVQPQQLLPPPEVIQYSGDCIGYDSAALALHFLGVNFRLGYQSEWEDHMQELANITHSYIKHHEGRMFKDMTTRPRSRGAAHLLIATTPCPDFSTAGKHKGTKGSRGCLWYESIDVVLDEMPRVFLAENVRGLTTEPHKKDFHEAIQILQEAGYVVRHRILVTEDHGIPQRRQRVFLIAIRLDSLNPQMVIDHADLSGFLELEPVQGEPLVRERYECQTFRNNMKHARDRFGAAKLSQKGNCMVDIGAGQHKVVTFGVSPTLTSSRADSLSWYLPWRKQRLTLMEAGRLQGLPDDLTKMFESSAGKRKTGFAIGNALSVNVVERLLGRLLWAANLVAKPLPDNWLELSCHPRQQVWCAVEEQRKAVSGHGEPMPKKARRSAQ